MAFKVTGIILEKKEKHWEDKQGNDKANYSIVLGCLGFPLTHEVDYKDWLEYKEGDFLSLRIVPNNKSIVVSEKKTYDYFEPMVTGIKKAVLKDITEIPKAVIGVMEAEVISLGKNEDGTSKGNYSRVLLEGALMGEMTGAEDFAKGLKELTQYECNMTIAFKKGVFQIIPTNFKEIGVIASDF